MDLRPFISHAALRQRGPNEHNPSKRNLNKSGTMGGPQSRAAAVRTFPPTPARPCPFHHSFIMLMELSLQIQKDLICDCLSAALSCVCLCARVCSRGTAGLTHSILLHFFLSSFFPNQRAAIMRIISQKRRALQKTCPCPQPRGESTAPVRNSAESVQMWFYFKKRLVVTYCRISKSAGFFLELYKSLS